MKKRFLTGVLCLTAMVCSAEELATPVPGIEVSGTLPVCYVNTEEGAPILDRENYVAAVLWIDPMGLPDVEAFGSAENPVTLKIRGRGNSSWEHFGKKPYKLKFDSKVSPFGYPKNKNFALIAHAQTQSYFNGETAYEIARLIDDWWVPNSFPVEVVLNGVNVGVYAFSETVKIDKGRLAIAEQPDGNEDDATLTEGWLVEMDNTEDTPQLLLPQRFSDDAESFQTKRFTIKTPEVLSEKQELWITDELTQITKAVFNPDKSDDSWTEYLDIESLAKYYIVQEVSCNFDAFVGSTYFYKDKGEKWKFGPIWDSEWTWVPSKRTDSFFVEREIYTKYNSRKINFGWIRELLQFPTFRKEVLRIWDEFYPDQYSKVYDFVENWYNLTKQGYETNGLIWPGNNAITIQATHNTLKKQTKAYAEWFDALVRSKEFQEEYSGIEEVVPQEICSDEIYDLAGRYVGKSIKNVAPGIYIRSGKKILKR